MSCEQTSCLNFFIFAKRNFIDEKIHINIIDFINSNNEEYDLNLAEYVTTITHENLNNSSELLFDLTQLIQTEKLTSKYNKNIVKFQFYIPF